MQDEGDFINEVCPTKQLLKKLHPSPAPRQSGVVLGILGFLDETIMVLRWHMGSLCAAVSVFGQEDRGALQWSCSEAFVHEQD